MLSNNVRQLLAELGALFRGDSEFGMSTRAEREPGGEGRV